MTPDDQFSLLRHGQYRIYFATRVATALAYQMLFVAVGWQVYDLTNSALDLGLVGLLLFIPSVPGTLLVGHVADHYDRRWVIRLAQIGKAICAGVLTVGSVTGTLSVYVIFSTVLAIGFCRAFDTPTLNTLVPGIVPKEMISRAVAGGSMANQVATISGPALGGILYIFGPEVVYGLCFLAFITASILVGFIRLSYPPREKKPITLETVFAGFTYLRQNRIIFGAISLDLCVIMLGGVIALLPVYARDILETGPWGLGLLRSAPAVGALIATIFLTRATLRRNSGKLIVWRALYLRILGVGVRHFQLAAALVCRAHGLWGNGYTECRYPPVDDPISHPKRQVGAGDVRQFDVHQFGQHARTIRVRGDGGDIRRGAVGVDRRIRRHRYRAVMDKTVP